MFTAFGVQYAGYIDMAHVGYDGTPVNDRWFPNERLSEVFANARHLAQLAERLGYDSLWTAEHHFQREGYECIPNVLLLNVSLASQTTRLKLGCGFNITPMWHPLRLAEDFAMADIPTNGRVIFGVGRGYHTRGSCSTGLTRRSMPCDGGGRWASSCPGTPGITATPSRTMPG